MSFTPRRKDGLLSPGSSTRLGGSTGKKSAHSSTNGAEGSVLDDTRTAVSRVDVDMAQFGILGWKEYALLKYSDNPKFYNSAVGKDLIVESAMWELQQKLIAIEAWADEVEVAAFELENNLRKEKKARLKAEAKLRKLEVAITRNPPKNVSESILEQSRESLVRSPPRVASPLDVGMRSMSPPRSGAVSSPASTSSPLSGSVGPDGRIASPSHTRRGSGSASAASRGRSRSPLRRGDAAKAAAAAVAAGGSQEPEKSKGRFKALVSSFLGRSTSKSADSEAGGLTVPSPPTSPTNAGSDSDSKSRSFFGSRGANKRQSSAASADEATSLAGVGGTPPSSLGDSKSELERKIERALSLPNP